MDTLAPNAANYLKGGGVFAFARTGTTGMLDLGNLPDVAISAVAEYLEHFTSRDGVLVRDRKDQIKRGVEFKLGLDELSADNLALIFGAEEPSALTQAEDAAGTKSIATPELGKWYTIGAFRVNTVVVKVGVTTKTEGTDYEVHEVFGWIRFIPGGGILASDTVDITYKCPAIAGYSVAPFTKVEQVTGTGAIAIVASDGRVLYWDLPSVSIGFEGELSVTGSEWAKATATVTIEPDFTRNDPFGTLKKLPAAA